jgi:PAS domain-containing protein
MDPALTGLIEGIPPARLALAAAVAALLALVLLVALGLQIGARRRAQRAAGEARGHLRTVTSTMREGVVAYDMDLHLRFANAAFERLTGYPEEDLRDQEDSTTFVK